MRPLRLHASALNHDEYHLYTTSLNDLAWADDTDSGQTHDDAYYEQMKIGIREARGWLRGRFFDSFRRISAQGDVLTEGKSFAWLRLAVHAEKGKDIHRTLAFVQAHPSASASPEKTTCGCCLRTAISIWGNHHRPRRPQAERPIPQHQHLPCRLTHSRPPICPSTLHNSTTRKNSRTLHTIPLLAPRQTPDRPYLRAKRSRLSHLLNRAPSSSPLPRANPPSNTALSHLHRSPPQPHSTNAINPPSRSSQTSSTLMNQSLQASKAAQTMKPAEAQLEQERMLQVLKSSAVVLGTQVRNSYYRSIGPGQVVMNTQGQAEVTFHRAVSVSMSSSESSEEGMEKERERERKASPLPRRRNTHTQQQPSPPVSISSLEQIALVQASSEMTSPAPVRSTTKTNSFPKPADDYTYHLPLLTAPH